MEDIHRGILRRNNFMLMREMFPELVAGQLYSDCILTSGMKEIVLMQLKKKLLSLENYWIVYQNEVERFSISFVKR